MPQLTTRRKIRNAAIRLFAEKGFAATTTREICERAKISKPVLYYHFRSKDELYRELFLDACTESRRRLAEAAKRGKNVRQKLVEVLAEDFALTRKDPKLSLMLFRMVFAPGKDEPAVDYIGMGMEWLRLLAGIISEGIRDGKMKGRPREIAEAFMGIHLIYTISYLFLREPEIDRALARRIVNLVLGGCSR